MVWRVMFINRLKGAFKMSSDIILDVRKLEKNYNTTTHEGKENIYSVLKGISFQVHKGEYIRERTYRKSMEKILPGYEERRLRSYFRITI